MAGGTEVSVLVPVIVVLGALGALRLVPELAGRRQKSPALELAL
jgi:hypothetical protein